MKVFIIQNTKGETFHVKNKIRFCEKFGITPRLLDYTIKGSSKTRYQEWHKQYKIKDIVKFIESEDGDKILWDSGIKGYFLKDYKEDNKEPEREKVNIQNYTTVNPNKEEIESLQKELIKTHRQKQKLQDQLNLNRKIMRDNHRHENMCELIKDTFKSFIESNVPEVVENNVENNKESVALILSDIHAGQKVIEVNNCFDYEIACDRLETIFTNFIKETKIRGIQNVSVLMLGDLIHCASALKPDMYASAEFLEIESTLKCFNLLSSQIDRLVRNFNKVSLASVIGNESRFNSHYHPSNLQKEAKNNLDVMIFEMLKSRYRDTETVEFINSGDELESVVTINGKNILMTHGNSNAINHKDLEKSFIHIRARLEPIYGELDAMVLGHIHSTAIHSKVFRNASLVGSNSYSNFLGFAESPVSQNMLIISENRIIGFPLYCK